MVRDRQVQRVGTAVDEHHAVLAPGAVLAPRVDVRDRQQVGAGQRLGGLVQPCGVLDERKVLAGVEARTAQQHRPFEVERREQGRPVGGRQLLARDAHDARRHHARDREKPLRVLDATRRAHRRRMVHDRRLAAAERGLDDVERPLAAIGFGDRVEHDAVRRQRARAGIRLGDQGRDFEHPVVEQVLDRNVAAAGRRQQQHANRLDGAAVRRDLDRAVGKRLAPLALGFFAAAAAFQRRRVAATCFAQGGIEPQGLLERGGRRVELVVLEHRFAEPHMRRRTVRIPRRRLEEEDASGLGVARRDEQLAERDHRLAVAAVASEHVEVRAFGVVAQAERFEQPGAFEPQRNRGTGVAFEMLFEGSQPVGLGHPARRPRAERLTFLHARGWYGHRLTTC